MKALKWLVAIVAACIVLYSCWIVIALYRLPPVARLADQDMNLTIQVKDWHGKHHPFIVGPKNSWWTPSKSIPTEMEWAVIVAEDARFYQHDGIDAEAIKNAIKYDVKKRSFALGASTITQQTAKNLFLTQKKTLSRKIEEIYLAKRMEQELPKERILELYLNIVELGPMVFGIGHGAHYYFDKPPRSLTPRECAFLAAMLPGPQKVYNPYRHMDRVLKRSDMILRYMRAKGVLTEAAYREAMAETPDINGMQRKVDRSLSGKIVNLFKKIFGFGR